MNREDLQQLSQVSLLQGLTPDQIARVMELMGAYARTFHPGETIISRGDECARMGFVLTGEALIVDEGAQGDSSIVEVVRPGETFAEVVNCMGIAHFPYRVITQTTTRVVMGDIRKLLIPYSTHAATPECAVVVSHLVSHLAGKSLKLRAKVEVLSRRTIRGKLACYLLHLQKAQQTMSVEIPFSRTALAEYLCVNRTALSREVSALSDEGIIAAKGRTFTICDLEALQFER